MQECAAVALGLAARWLYLINQEFLELKSYLCVQLLDQARHIEGLRKRALAGGQGLKRASVTAEQALKELAAAETYAAASVGGNVLLGSPECVEPLIILSGGGTAPEQVAVGSQQVARLQAGIVAEYLERCEGAGLRGRSERSRLPHYLQQLGL